MIRLPALYSSYFLFVNISLYIYHCLSINLESYTHHVAGFARHTGGTLPPPYTEVPTPLQMAGLTRHVVGGWLRRTITP